MQRERPREIFLLVCANLDPRGPGRLQFVCAAVVFVGFVPLRIKCVCQPRPSWSWKASVCVCCCGVRGGCALVDQVCVPTPTLVVQESFSLFVLHAAVVVFVGRGACARALACQDHSFTFIHRTCTCSVGAAAWVSWGACVPPTHTQRSLLL